MFKKTIVASAICVSVHMGYADMALHIIDESSFYNVEIPSSNCGEGRAEGNNGCYWGAEGSGPENKWDNNPPPLDTPLSTNSNYPTNINLSHATGSSGTLISELQLNVYDKRTGHFVGNCYLIDANEKQNQGIEAYAIGQYATKNEAPTFYPTSAPNRNDSECPYLRASFVGGGAIQSGITITLIDNTPPGSSMQQPTVTATLLANNFSGSGENLYRLDINSAVLTIKPYAGQLPPSQVQYIDIEPGVLEDVTNPENITYLPPLKTFLAFAQGSGIFPGTDQIYSTSKASLYIIDTSKDVLKVKNEILRQSSTSKAIILPTTYPEGESTLNAAEFAVGLTPLIATSAGGNTTNVMNNGMDQTPVRVQIYYDPTDQGQFGSNDIISPSYHPELMYLYGQVFFTDLYNQEYGFISNLQYSPNSASNTTVITNYPGPYVAVPENSGVIGNYSQANYDESPPASNGSIVGYNNAPIYYLSTTQGPSTIDLAVNLEINDVTVQTYNGSSNVIVNIVPPYSNEQFDFSGNQAELTAGNGIIGVYNVDNIGTQQSAANYLDLTNDYILGVSRYVDGSMQVPLDQNNADNIFVNSDGSISLPQDQGTLAFGVQTVDIFGNLKVLNTLNSYQAGEK